MAGILAMKYPTWHNVGVLLLSILGLVAVFKVVNDTYSVTNYQFFGKNQLLERAPHHPERALDHPERSPDHPERAPDHPSVQNDASAWVDVIQALQHTYYTPIDCPGLFHKVAEGQFYPKEVQEIRSQFHAQVKEVGKGKSGFEGNSGTLKEQSFMYYLLGAQPWVKTVCETGFNAGHSTLQWLTANPTSKVYSFDMGSHYYTRPMVEYLQSKFPARLEVTFGDSTKTLPNFTRAHPSVKCDIAVVDGGHSFKVARADLLNMHPMTHPGSLLILDDTILGEAQFAIDVMNAWQSVVDQNMATKIFHCVYKKASRGFLLGRYNHTHHT